jgi:hypothetical protein
VGFQSPGRLPGAYGVLMAAAAPSDPRSAIIRDATASPISMPLVFPGPAGMSPSDALYDASNIDC